MTTARATVEEWRLTACIFVCAARRHERFGGAESARQAWAAAVGAMLAWGLA